MRQVLITIQNLKYLLFIYACDIIFLKKCLSEYASNKEVKFMVKKHKF